MYNVRPLCLAQAPGSDSSTHSEIAQQLAEGISKQTNRKVHASCRMLGTEYTSDCPNDPTTVFDCATPEEWLSNAKIGKEMDQRLFFIQMPDVGLTDTGGTVGLDTRGCLDQKLHPISVHVDGSKMICMPAGGTHADGNE